MRARILALCATLALIAGLGAQSRQMARIEPHMSAAAGHLERAKNELEKATATKGGHRENAMRLVDQAIQEVRAGESYDVTH